MLSMTGGCELPVSGKGVVRGVGDGSLSSPEVTSYRLPIVTICLLSLTVFAVL